MALATLHIISLSWALDETANGGDYELPCEIWICAKCKLYPRGYFIMYGIRRYTFLSVMQPSGGYKFRVENSTNLDPYNVLKRKNSRAWETHL